MFTDIYSNLERELGKFIDLGGLRKYCPNCGNELDSRIFWLKPLDDKKVSKDKRSMNTHFGEKRLKIL